MENSGSEPATGDQYNLKWNNHLANFVQTFIEHQNGETLVDVTLSCEGQYIKTHKLILSACSDYFHSIFQVHNTLQHPIIFLNGVRFCDLKYILHFMYHGEVKVLDKDLPHVLALGESLQIKGLSSVKLRDVPPDSAPVPVQKLPAVNKRVIKNLQSNSNNVTRPVQSSRSLLLNEVPPQVPMKNDTKPAYDYSRSKLKVVSPSQINLKEPLTTLPHVSVEKPLANLPVLNESSSKTSTSRTQEIPNLGNGTADNKNVIPKAPHAFMIFAAEWRKKLTVEHPEENNKEISVRLGNMWKNLLPETKSIYYREEKRAAEEHKLKYPNLDSSNNDSLKRKADVLQDSTNSSSPKVGFHPLDFVEIQEQVDITDSD